MQKAYLNPTPDQTFEIVGDGPYNFTRVLAHTRELEAAGNVEDACNERYQAFQRLAGLLPEDEEINLEWSHRNSQSALELIRASAIDHFLINDFEMSAALLEMLLELDPEDHLGERTLGVRLPGDGRAGTVRRSDKRRFGQMCQPRDIAALVGIPS